MGQKTGIGSIKNPGNIANHPDEQLDMNWFAYRKDKFGRDELWLANSTDAINWDTFKLDDIGITPRLDNNPQLVSHETGLYLFWIDDDDHVLRATKRAIDPKNPQVTWMEYVTCQTNAGKDIEDPDNDDGALLAAISVGQRLLVALLHEDKIEFQLMPTDETDYRTGTNTWKAFSGNSISLDQINAHLPGGDIKKFLNRTSMAMYSVDVDNTYLVQTIFVEDDDGDDRYVVVQMKLPADPLGYGLPQISGGTASWWSNKDDRGIVLVNDPGGRILAAGLDDDDAAFLRTMSTDVFPGTWETKHSASDIEGKENPAVFFSFGPPTAAVVDGKTSETRSVTRHLFVIDDDQDAIEETAPYGQIRQIFKYDTVNITEATPNRYIYLNGYIDGPPPVFDGMVDADSEVRYAVTSSVSGSLEVVSSVNYAVQIKGSAGVEVKAVGLEATASVEASLSTTAAVGFKITNTRSMNENTILQLTETPTGAFAQKGLVRASELVMTCDVYDFVPEGQTQPSSNSSQFSQVYLDTRADTKIEYTLAKDAVVVGDLLTYTREAWNKRMAATGLYPGVDDYIAEIVLPKAVAFQNGTAAVQDTWSPISPIENSFSSTTEMYVSSSMEMEASVLAGASVGFLGNSLEAMRGLTFSIGTTAEAVTNNEFGVEVSLSGKTDGTVQRYLVSTFFLKADNNWVREFNHFYDSENFNVSISDDAECWKIMYVVDDIEYNDPVSALDLSDAARARLSGAGVTDTAGALGFVGLTYPADLTGKRAPSLADATVSEVYAALTAWDAKRNLYTR